MSRLLTSSRQSRDDYFTWRYARSTRALARLNQIYPLTDKKVLDLGCGYGAMSQAVLDLGAEVWSIDVNADSLAIARGKVTSPHAHFSHVPGEELPFENNFFDLVILFDSIEHVNSPKQVLEGVQRVLKPGGIAYFEFGPFYSITGHHLYDVTKRPIHLYWNENKIKDFVLRQPARGFITPQMMWDGYLSCNKMTINEFKKYYRQLNFLPLKERYILKYPPFFEINLGFLSYLDWLSKIRDFPAMSFEGIYQVGL